jgi:uncharacterized protein YukE
MPRHGHHGGHGGRDNDHHNNHGGNHGRRDHHPKTNFPRYSHPHLYQMLHDGDESTPRSAADSWDGIGARLHEQAGNLDAKLAAFKEQWQGDAAEQYQLMVTDLSTGLRRIGNAMFSMRDATHEAADSLVTAKATMPPPVAVPEVSPTTVFLATTPVEIDPMASTQEVATLRRRQADASVELAGYQQAVQAADSAHAKAVAVMNELSVEYQVAGDGIPVTPSTGAARALPQGEGFAEVTEADADDVDADGKTAPPVFGTMFTAGVAAAAAATAGRLGMRLVPKVPDWAKKTDKDKAKAEAAEKAAGKVGGGGGLGKLGGGVGGFGSHAPLPAAHPGMLGGGAAAGSAAAALRAAAGAAGAGAAMPFMPFMPMAPMGMGGANARRVPPWLTETEDVWGESSVITPPVLGEDPPEPRRRPTDFSF